MTRHLGVIVSPFHYGAFFSLLIAIPLGVLLSLRSPRAPGFHLVMLVLFLILTLHNFLAINHTWVTAQYNFTEQDRPMISREFISKLWEGRANSEFVNNQLAPFAGGGDWLQEELKNIK